MCVKFHLSKIQKSIRYNIQPEGMIHKRVIFSVIMILFSSKFPHFTSFSRDSAHLQSNTLLIVLGGFYVNSSSNVYANLNTIFTIKTLRILFYLWLLFGRKEELRQAPGRFWKQTYEIRNFRPSGSAIQCRKCFAFPELDLGLPMFSSSNPELRHAERSLITAFHPAGTLVFDIRKTDEGIFFKERNMILIIPSLEHN